MSTHQRRASNKAEPRFQRKHGGVWPFDLNLDNGVFGMSNKDNNKPGGKPGQRNRKAGRKPDQRQSPKQPDQQNANVRIDATLASTGTPPIGAIAAADTRSVDAVIAPINNTAIDAAVAPVDSSAAGAAIASAQTASVSLQTIATAYGDYTKKSFEETKSFVEKLSGVRSLDKAVEIQTEFAKQAYETFVAESQKIRQLYGELAKQTLKPLQGLAGKTTRDAR
jgi:hypothetical protein